jgi:hypothetical protein
LHETALFVVSPPIGNKFLLWQNTVRTITEFRSTTRVPFIARSTSSEKHWYCFVCSFDSFLMSMSVSFYPPFSPTPPFTTSTHGPIFPV